jgi:hypothetical protein
MTKLLIRSILSLSFLLLIGYGALSVHATPVYQGSSPAKVSESTRTTCIDPTQESWSSFVYIPLKDHDARIYAGEVREKKEEEHNSTFLKRKSVNSNSFTGLFCAHAAGCFSRQIFSFSHRRHLIVQVFRI